MFNPQLARWIFDPEENQLEVSPSGTVVFFCIFHIFETKRLNNCSSNDKLHLRKYMNHPHLHIPCLGNIRNNSSLSEKVSRYIRCRSLNPTTTWLERSIRRGYVNRASCLLTAYELIVTRLPCWAKDSTISFR